MKGKAEAGKQWVKGKVSGRGKPKTHEEDIQDRWAKGMAAVRQISARSSSGGMATADLHGALAEVKTTYGFQEIRATRQGTGWGVYAKLNPDNADRLVPISGKTLLVGEGNLTFTESNIILGRLVPGDVTATVYEKKEQKAPTTQARGERLQDQGVTVEYGVDATKLHEGAEAKPKFDTIVWMFPHPGGERAQVVAAGQQLLAAFFASAVTRLNPGGRITVTLRKAKRDWYISRWDPVGSAAAAGLKLERRNDFEQGDYEGYTHETTDKGARKADITTGYTFVFTL